MGNRIDLVSMLDRGEEREISLFVNSPREVYKQELRNEGRLCHNIEFFSNFPLPTQQDWVNRTIENILIRIVFYSSTRQEIIVKFIIGNFKCGKAIGLEKQYFWVLDNFIFLQELK